MPVLDAEKKLEAFNNSIMDTVFDEALKHLDEMHAREAEIMEKAEKEIKEEVKHYRQRRFAEIRTAESHRVTTRMTENKRTILQLREEQAREDRSCAMLLITDSCAEKVPEPVKELKLSATPPLLVTIPPATGRRSGSESITDLIAEAIGVKL